MAMGRRILIAFLTAICLAVIPVGPVLAAELPRLILPPEIMVEGGRVHLDAVGTLVGPSALLPKLAGIDLGEAPPPGQFRLLTRNYVEFKLVQAGVGQDELKLEMAERVRLVGAGTQLTAERIRDFLRQDLAAEVPEAWIAWDLHLAGALSPYWLPPGRTAFVREPLDAPLKPGNNLLKLRVVKDGRVLRRFTLAVQIRAKARVPVLKADIKRHHTLDLQAIVWEERELKGGELTALPETPVRATRWLRQGEPLQEGEIEPVPQVTKGGRVLIECYTNGIRIRVPGKARRDGWQGQVIPVVNIDSGKTVLARVVGAGKVEVE
jgi:flagella basal body P-ring formation protein FlgA